MTTLSGQQHGRRRRVVQRADDEDVLAAGARHADPQRLVVRVVERLHHRVELAVEPPPRPLQHKVYRRLVPRLAERPVAAVVGRDLVEVPEHVLQPAARGC